MLNLLRSICVSSTNDLLPFPRKHNVLKTNLIYYYSTCLLSSFGATPWSAPTSVANPWNPNFHPRQVNFYNLFCPFRFVEFAQLATTLFFQVLLLELFLIILLLFSVVLDCKSNEIRLKH